MARPVAPAKYFRRHKCRNPRYDPTQLRNHVRGKPPSGLSDTSCIPWDKYTEWEEKECSESTENYMSDDEVVVVCPVRALRVGAGSDRLIRGHMIE